MLRRDLSFAVMSVILSGYQFNVIYYLAWDMSNDTTLSQVKKIHVYKYQALLLLRLIYWMASVGLISQSNSWKVSQWLDNYSSAICG
jgi:hypothetical protein